MVTKTKKRRIPKNNTSYENLKEGIGKYWGAFYKKNPHRFAIDYLEVNLHIFQQVIIYMMMSCNQSTIIATRGLGKSWLLAVYACVKAILYPGSQILVAAKRKKQAKLLITTKIMNELYNKSEALRREIKSTQTSSNEVWVEFWNGSRIEAVVSNEDARGYRANVLVIDEYRMIPQKIVDTVLLPFLNTPRQPGYLSNPKYAHMIEENEEVYLSSGWYQHEWSYGRYKETVKGMLNNEHMFACNLPFTVSIEHGLLTKLRIKKEMTKESMSESSFIMEYCGQFYNESDSAFFKSQWVNPCRTIEGVFYPPTIEEYLKYKDMTIKPKYKLPKLKGEIRILSADIALAKGKRNDNSAYILARLLPDGDRYKRVISHIETYNGMEAEQQAIRIKQLMEDFDIDKMIIDTGGVGTTVWSYLQKSNYDNERDIWHEAYTCFNEDNTVDKAANRNALPIVYSMKAYADTNSKIALSLRDVLINRKMLLPISSIDAKEVVFDKSNVKTSNMEERAYLEAKLLQPFAQTDALVNELITLEYEMREGKVKISEKSGNRKDRYSALGYLNFLANLIEEDEYKKGMKRKNKFFFLSN